MNKTTDTNLIDLQKAQPAANPQSISATPIGGQVSAKAAKAVKAAKAAEVDQLPKKKKIPEALAEQVVEEVDAKNLADAHDLQAPVGEPEVLVAQADTSDKVAGNSTVSTDALGSAPSASVSPASGAMSDAVFWGLGIGAAGLVLSNSTASRPTMSAVPITHATPNASLNDTGRSASDGITSSAVITAPNNAGTGATVEYRIKAGNGVFSVWSTSYTPPTVDGNYTVEVRQSDRAGNTSASQSIAFTLDTAAPDVVATVMTVNRAAKTITLDLGEDLAGVSLVQDDLANLFVVTTPVSGVATRNAVASAVIDDEGRLVLTLAQAFNAGQVNLVYTKPNAGDVLEDLAGNDVASFFSGVVADGYIRDADVWIDTDGNGEPDLNTGVKSNAEGQFFLPVQLAIQGALVMVGGVNIDTGLPNTVSLKAPRIEDFSQPVVINPLTTLVQSVIEQAPVGNKPNPSAAAQTVAGALGLGNAVNLLSFDPISMEASIRDAAERIANQQDRDALESELAAKRQEAIDALKAAAQVVAAATLVGGDDADTGNAVLAVFASKIAENASNGVTQNVTEALTSALTQAAQSSNNTALRERLGDVQIFSDVVEAAQIINSATSVQAISQKQAELLDRVAPLAPQVDVAANTKDTTPEITLQLNTTDLNGGAVVQGDVVTVLVDGATAQTVTIDAAMLKTGEIQVSLTTPLAPGAHVVSAYITDLAGLTGSAAGPAIINIDTLAPSVRILSSPDPIGAGQTGTLRFVFSEVVNDFTAADVAVSAGTLGQLSGPLALDGGGVAYTAPYTAPTTVATGASLNVTVAEGSYTDLAGNSGSGSGAALGLNAVNPPVVGISGVGGADSVVSAQGSDNVIRGTGKPGVVVTLSTTDGAALGSTMADANGNWSYDLTPANLGTLGQGSGKTITASQTDGDQSGSAQISFGIDTEAPAVAASAAGRTLSGTAAADAQVRLELYGPSGDVNRLVTVAPNGGWTYTLSAQDIRNLGDGEVKVKVSAQDAAGNRTTTADLTLTVDDTPPALTLFDLATNSDTGLPGDRTTNNATPTITFRASGASSVTLWKGSTELGIATADSQGNYTFTLGEGVLAQGSNTLAVVASDAVGNTTTRTGTVVLDTQAPTAILATAQQEVISAAQATVAYTLTLSKSVLGELEASDFTISGGSVQAVSRRSPTQFEVQVAPQSGFEGELHVTLKADALSDLAGNSSSATAATALSVDTKAPVALAMSLSNDTGLVSDLVTSRGSLDIANQEAGATLQYSTDGQTWTNTAFLAREGENTVYVRQTDAAGNTSASQSISFTLDTTAPAFSSAIMANADENQDLLYTAQATDASGLVAFTLAGADSGRLNITADGKVTLKNGVLDFEAADGKTSYNFDVIASDLAGNQSTRSVAVTVTDVTETATLAISNLADSSVAENAGYTSATPSLSGAIGAVSWSLEGADKDLFTVNANGVVSMVARDFEAPADAGTDNVYNYTLKATDADGNVATKEVAVTVTDVEESAGNPTETITVAENTQPITVVYTPAVQEGAVYSLSGTDAAFFVVDPATGQMTFRNLPDYESKSTYIVDLTTTGTGAATTKTLVFELTDGNDPFTAMAVNGVNSSVLTENTNTAQRIKVADIALTDDAFATSYEFYLSGADKDAFEVDVATRSLYLRAGIALNYEAKASYEVTVTATETPLAFMPAATKSSNFMLNVADQNEAPSSLLLQNAVGTLQQGTTASAQKVADIALQDDALGSNQFTLIGGDAQYFTLTGNALFLKEGVALNYQTKARYDVAIQASDSTLGSNLATAYTLKVQAPGLVILAQDLQGDTHSILVDGLTGNWSSTVFGVTRFDTALAFITDGTTRKVVTLDLHEGKVMAQRTLAAGEYVVASGAGDAVFYVAKPDSTAKTTAMLPYSYLPGTATLTAGVLTTIKRGDLVFGDQPAYYFNVVANGDPTQFVLVPYEGYLYSSVKGGSWFYDDMPAVDRIDQVVFAGNQFWFRGVGQNALTGAPEYVYWSGGSTDWVNDYASWSVAEQSAADAALSSVLRPGTIARTGDGYVDMESVLGSASTGLTTQISADDVLALGDGEYLIRAKVTSITSTSVNHEHWIWVQTSAGGAAVQAQSAFDAGDDLLVRSVADTDAGHIYVQQLNAVVNGSVLSAQNAEQAVLLYRYTPDQLSELKSAVQAYGAAPLIEGEPFLTLSAAQLMGGVGVAANEVVSLLSYRPSSNGAVLISERYQQSTGARTDYVIHLNDAGVVDATIVLPAAIAEIKSIEFFGTFVTTGLDANGYAHVYRLDELTGDLSEIPQSAYQRIQQGDLAFSLSTGTTGNDTLGSFSATTAQALFAGNGQDIAYVGTGVDVVALGIGADTLVATQAAQLMGDMIDGGRQAASLDLIKLTPEQDGQVFDFQKTTVQHIDAIVWDSNKTGSMLISQGMAATADFNRNGLLGDVAVVPGRTVTADVMVGAGSLSASQSLYFGQTTAPDGSTWSFDGNDTVVGGGGNDVVFAGAGNDVVTGGAGADQLLGGTGADTFVYRSPTELLGDRVDGGAESATLDTLLLQASSANLAFDLNQAQSIRYIDQIAFANDQAGQQLILNGGVTGIAAYANANQDATPGDLKIIALLQMSQGVKVDGSALLQGQSLHFDGALFGGSDEVIGGAGEDLLSFKGGDDLMTGGGGADRFVMLSGASGGLSITDMNLGEDKLDVSAWGLGAGDELLVSRVEGHTRIDFYDNTTAMNAHVILLNNTQLSEGAIAMAGELPTWLVAVI